MPGCCQINLTNIVELGWTVGIRTFCVAIKFRLWGHCPLALGVCWTVCIDNLVLISQLVKFYRHSTFNRSLNARPKFCWFRTSCSVWFDWETCVHGVYLLIKYHAGLVTLHALVQMCWHCESWWQEANSSWWKVLGHAHNIQLSHV